MSKTIFNAPNVDLIQTGANLKAIRLSNQYSVSDIAEYANVSDAAVYAWESGKHLPDISNLAGLKSLYSLAHLDDLLVLI